MFCGFGARVLSIGCFISPGSLGGRLIFITSFCIFLSYYCILNYKSGKDKLQVLIFYRFCGIIRAVIMRISLLKFIRYLQEYCSFIPFIYSLKYYVPCYIILSKQGNLGRQRQAASCPEKKAVFLWHDHITGDSAQS